MWYRAVVADNADPAGLGRVRLLIPQLFGQDPTNWATPLDIRGSATVPGLGSQVWASFQGQTLEHPVYLPSIRDAVAGFVDTTTTQTVGGAKTFSALVTATNGVTSPSTVTGSALIPSGLSGATAVSRYIGATASGAPATGPYAQGDYAIARNGTIWICTVSGSPGTWTTPSVTGYVDTSTTQTVAGAKTFSNLVSATAGVTSASTVTGTAVLASGLTGATTATRYVGGTTTGAPTSGTSYAVGDFVVARDGNIWVCTAVASQPGTWVNLAANAPMRFATTTLRDTALPSPSTGMVVWTSDLAYVQYYTGSAWRPVSGYAVPSGATPQTMQSGSVAQTTTAAGDVTITFATAFASVPTVIVSNGDGNARANGVVAVLATTVSSTPGVTTAGFTARWWLGNTGAVIASLATRTNYIAIGSC